MTVPRGIRPCLPARKMQIDSVAPVADSWLQKPVEEVLGGDQRLGPAFLDVDVSSPWLADDGRRRQRRDAEDPVVDPDYSLLGGLLGRPWIQEGVHAVSA